MIQFEPDKERLTEGHPLTHYLVISAKCHWGKGETLEEAKKQLRKAGGGKIVETWLVDAEATINNYGLMEYFSRRLVEDS